MSLHRSFVIATSHMDFNGSSLPPLDPRLAVTTYFEFASCIRSAMASALNPANITEWTAPMRAHASMVMANSGTMGMYSVTTSPLRTPLVSNALDIRHTSPRNSSYVILRTSVGSSPSHMIAISFPLLYGALQYLSTAL
jgi:hypothetical protein